MQIYKPYSIEKGGALTMIGHNFFLPHWRERLARDRVPRNVLPLHRLCNDAHTPPATHSSLTLSKIYIVDLSFFSSSSDYYYRVAAASHIRVKTKGYGSPSFSKMWSISLGKTACKLSVGNPRPNYLKEMIFQNPNWWEGYNSSTCILYNIHNDGNM